MRRPAFNRGFTLLELLVAVTITLVVAGLMLAVTAQVLRLWQRSQAGQTQAATARQVFALLEQDLHAAIHRRDANHWLAVDILDSPGSLANHGWLLGPGLLKPANGGSLLPLPAAETGNDGGLPHARFGLSGCWLRFVTTTVESGGSLPAVVAYQIARRPITGDPLATNPAAVRYSLYRSAISNSDTLSLGSDVLAEGYASSTNTVTSAGSTAYRTGRNVMNPSHANLLGSNIVDFGCWLHVRNPDQTLRRIYPAGPGDRSHHAVGGSTADDTRYPLVADLMLRILSEEGATRLEAIETGRVPRPAAHPTDAGWWWSVVEANSRVFTCRIEIRGGAL